MEYNLYIHDQEEYERPWVMVAEGSYARLKELKEKIKKNKNLKDKRYKIIPKEENWYSCK